MQFDDDGVLYITSKNNHSVLTYDADTGVFLGALVTPGLGGLNGPRGLLILPEAVPKDVSRAALRAWSPSE